MAGPVPAGTAGPRARVVVAVFGRFGSQSMNRVWADVVRWLRRWRGPVAGVLAVTLAISLTVAVLQRRGSQPTAPAQRTWGNVAVRPHRVPASATIERLAGGRLVPYAAGRPLHVLRPSPVSQAAVLSAARRPRGAVPPQRRPAKVRIHVAAGSGALLRHPHQGQAAQVLGYQPRTNRMLPGQASANKVVYANADGTWTAFVYQGPVNYRRRDGSWARISTALVPAGAAAAAGQGAAGWREASEAFPQAFAGYADAGQLVRFPVDARRAVAFGVAGAAHVAGAAQGGTVTYPGARPGADLRFIAGTGLVKEQIILRSAAASASWVFPLALTGLTARAGPHGTLEFTDAAGRVRAVVPHGSMTDSNINPRSGNGAYSSGVSYSLTTLAGRPAIRMRLDRSWLDAPGRVFPVTVDPSVSSFNSTGTTYVESPFNNDFSTDTEMDVGTYDYGTNPQNIAKSFMKFDVSSLNNDTVVGCGCPCSTPGPTAATRGPSTCTR